MDRHETAQVLSVLRAAYPSFYRGMGKSELEGIVDLWASMFANDDPALVGVAVKALIATDVKGYPPHIGAVKDKLRQISTPAQMTEAEAWGYVRKALSNSLYGSDKEFEALPDLLKGLVGSPSQLREWAMMDEATVQSVVASNFQRSYRARAQYQRDFEALPGDVQQLARQIGGALDMGRLPEVGNG